MGSNVSSASSLRFVIQVNLTDSANPDTQYAVYYTGRPTLSSSTDPALLSTVLASQLIKQNNVWMTASQTPTPLLLTNAQNTIVADLVSGVTPCSVSDGISYFVGNVSLPCSDFFSCSNIYTVLVGSDNLARVLSGNKSRITWECQQ